MNRFFAWFIAIVLVGAVCWRFPLFHVVKIETAAQQKKAATFDPTLFAQKFWDGKLSQSLDKAVKADVLLPAIQTSPGEARKDFSHTLGVSDNYEYFISGEGRVLSVSDDEIALALSDKSTTPDIVLHVGLLFGDTLRDGTGLLNVSDFPNSQDFNAIAEALNHIVEERVLPILHKQAKVGSRVRFVGCAEVGDEATDLKPLRVIPIQAEVQ